MSGPRILPWRNEPGETYPIIGGMRFFRFDDGSWFMQRADGPLEGEGTQVSDAALREALMEFFSQIM